MDKRWLDEKSYIYLGRYKKGKWIKGYDYYYSSYYTRNGRVKVTMWLRGKWARYEVTEIKKINSDIIITTRGNFKRRKGGDLICQ